MPFADNNKCKSDTILLYTSGFFRKSSLFSILNRKHKQIEAEWDDTSEQTEENESCLKQCNEMEEKQIDIANGGFTFTVRSCNSVKHTQNGGEKK